ERDAQPQHARRRHHARRQAVGRVLGRGRCSRTGRHTVTARVKKLSPTVVCVLIGAAGVFVLAAGMFAFVVPPSHKPTSLADDVPSTRTQIVTARALATQKPEEKIRAADLFKVVEAMPDDTDMTGVILQLQQTAGEAGVRFDSITPGSAQTGAGYDIQPI